MTKKTSTVTEAACSVHSTTTSTIHDFLTTYTRPFDERGYTETCTSCTNLLRPLYRNQEAAIPKRSTPTSLLLVRTAQILIPPRGLTAPREQRAYSHEGPADTRPPHPYEQRNSDRLRWVPTSTHHYRRGDAMMAIEKTMLRRAIAKGIRTNCDMQA